MDCLNRNVCRICLTHSLRLRTITNSPLQTVYEKLTEIDFYSLEIDKVCYICYARLKQSYNLKEQAVAADKLLRGSLLPNEQTYSKLTKSMVITLNLAPTENKKEIFTEIKSEIRNEVFLEESHYTALINENNTELEDLKEFSDSGNDISSNLDIDTLDIGKNIHSKLDSDIKFNFNTKGASDSDDDMPLVNIQLKKNLKGKVEKRRKYKRQTQLESKEILLSEEDQRQEMLDRSKSDNYINSPYKCNLCYRGFVDAVAFDRHKEKHDESRGPFSCSVCSLRYCSRKRLSAHTATHARRYLCARCPHRANTKHQAKAHEQWHDGHTYPCQPCGKVFTKPTSLLSHTRRCAARAQVGESVCTVCGDSFPKQHGLVMHMSKSHRLGKQETSSEPEGDRTCDTCCIVFANSKAKLRHLLTSRRHTMYNNESECNICGSQVLASMRGTHARAHRRQLRPAPAPAPPLHLQCQQCKSSFTSRPKLQSHVRRMHLGLKYNKNIVCEVCGKKCTSYAGLRYHQRQHSGEKPYVCAQCGRAFPRAGRLRAHVRAHAGLRPHACRLCARAFAQRAALTRHLRVHTGAKPYACHICDRRFSQSNSLHAHVRALHLKLPRQPRTQKPNPNSTLNATPTPNPTTTLNSHPSLNPNPTLNPTTSNDNITSKEILI